MPYFYRHGYPKRRSPHIIKHMCTKILHTSPLLPPWRCITLNHPWFNLLSTVCCTFSSPAVSSKAPHTAPLVAVTRPVQYHCQYIFSILHINLEQAILSQQTPRPLGTSYTQSTNSQTSRNKLYSVNKLTDPLHYSNPLFISSSSSIFLKCFFPVYFEYIGVCKVVQRK